MTCDNHIHIAKFHTNFSPTAPHFYKIMLEQTLGNTKLQIPKAFWVKCCGSLSSQVFLKLPCGSTWEVGLTKSSDGKVWIEKGWNKFVQHCSISRGNILVFGYEGNSEFHVIIFDKTTMEIDYSSNPNNFDKHNVVDIDDDDSIEVLDSFPRYPKTRDKSPIPCSRPQKKMRSSVPVMQKGSLPSKVDKSTPKRYQKPSSEIEKHNVDDTKDDISIEVLDKSPLPCSARPHKKMKTSPCVKSEAKFDLSDEVCGESQVLREVEPEKFIRKKCLSGKSKAKALMRAKGFKSKDPFFIVPMQPSVVGAGFRMNVPFHFARTYLSKSQDVILKVQDGRNWSVKYFSRQYEGSSRYSRFECGWKAFVQDNELEVGDVCAFVLRNSIDDITLFEVVIFYYDKDKARMISQNSVAKKESGLSRACEAANRFFSKNPYFQVILRSTHVHGHVLYIPLSFARDYLEGKTQTIVLWVGEECCYVKLLVNGSDYKFCGGWCAFVRDNSLQLGDVCIFELLKGYQAEMKVHIFRQTGLIQQ
ncbi:hypothetical protein CsatA_014126 [Cannabis sativa]